MEAQDWIIIMHNAVEENGEGRSSEINKLAGLLHEAFQAKEVLQRKGCEAKSLLEVANEIPPLQS